MPARPTFRLIKPSVDLRLSPELEPSAAFLSSTDLPPPAIHPSRSKSSTRRSAGSNTEDSGRTIGGSGASDGSRRRTSSGGSSSRERAPLSGRRRRSSSLHASPSVDAFNSDPRRSWWTELSLGRPSTLVLPSSLALFGFALVLTALDWRAAADRRRLLDTDLNQFASFDLADGLLPRLGWRTAADGGWWSAGSEPSPWDFGLESGADVTTGVGSMRHGGWGGRAQGKVRILFLTDSQARNRLIQHHDAGFALDFNDHLERMNTATAELISAAFAHPFVETDVWGPNWAGWQSERTISQNLAVRRVPSSEGGIALAEAGPGHFDLVWTISDIFPMDSPAIDNPGHGTLFAQQLGDCHSEDCVVKHYATVLNITTTKYPSELGDLFGFDRLARQNPDFKMHLFGHSSEGANRWDFHPPPSWEAKTVNLRGFGFDGSFYPIRTTVTDAIKAGRTPIEWFSHPGYSIPKPEDVQRPEFYELHSPLHDPHREKRSAFAAALRETKICVFDSSLERKLLRKVPQALLSGCVIATDLPTDREEDLLEFIIELKQGWSIETINTVLAAALADEVELKRKAMLGFAYARAHLTNTRKVEGMLRLWRGYLDGQRGYDFPSGFSLRCRQYWSNDDAYRPPWCAGPGLLGLEGSWDRVHEPPAGS